MPIKFNEPFLIFLLTVLAGVAGYFFREFKNRAKPFLAIKKIEGGFRKLGQFIEIDPKIVDRLKQAIYLKKLDNNDSLGEIYSTWEEVDKFVAYGKILLEYIDNIINAVEKNDIDVLKKSLSKLLSIEFFGEFLVLIIDGNYLKIPECDEEAKIIIQVYDSDEKDGCVWFDFHQKDVQFGHSFNKYAILKDKCLKFIKMISVLDIISIKIVFTSIKEFLQQEFEISKDCSKYLLDIQNENSRWEAQIFLANLGKNPFLINTCGELYVSDDSGAKFNEECYLVRLTQNDKGEIERFDANSPIVLGAEQDITFSYFTKNTQSEMKKGTILRKIFEEKSAKCQISFEIEKVGIIRKKILKTTMVPFQG